MQYKVVKGGGTVIPSQMLKGVLQGSVLAILSQAETYGYEIVQALTAYGFGAISEGTVYPLLLRLEKGGLVTARFLDSQVGPKRKYYALTPQGEEALAQFRASFWEMTAAVKRLPGFAEQEETHEPTSESIAAPEQPAGGGPHPGEPEDHD